MDVANKLGETMMTKFLTMTGNSDCYSSIQNTREMYA